MPPLACKDKKTKNSLPATLVRRTDELAAIPILRHVARAMALKPLARTILTYAAPPAPKFYQNFFRGRPLKTA